MLIPIEHEIGLLNLIQSPPYNGLPKPIQSGTQYVLASGVYCNFQYSSKDKEHFRFYVQNPAADQFHAETIENIALRVSVPEK
ncbi:hypothetical protein ACRZOS_002525 [Enterobacter kobei]|jgi:hypothetical protein